MQGVRWLVYIAAGVMIASSVPLTLWPMAWGLLCDPTATFVACEREFVFHWYWLVTLIPVPFAIYAIVAVRRSAQVADALVSGVLLLVLGVAAWLVAWFIATSVS